VRRPKQIKESDMSNQVRFERDSIGELAGQAEAYYGVHTARALGNFAVTGAAISQFPALIASLPAVKQAACQANRDLGLLDARRADAIRAACEEIRARQLHEQFPIDPIQV
jgi:aspartate ammonia-lyase